jgi:hypothetical protein
MCFMLEMAGNARSQSSPLASARTGPHTRRRPEVEDDE